ncbi:Beta-1,3-galactosyltransferase 6 [Pseudolycoriella hygida]|uniref:Hexosyltransferase n=1 Tax=Pseudolycoriella hygida TaxID=35572 RepID=A0A9Q0S692_9DIPT|nr:Beta-1,3-galactosyltransferase 6 [Pseudolycoriella hygida]
MNILYRVLSTRFLIPLLTFSIGCFLTNVFTNFSCSIDTEPPPKTECFLFILILSAPDNIESRNAIRETWLNLRPHHSTFSHHMHIPTYDEKGFLRQESIEEQANSLEVYKMWLKARHFVDKSSSTKIIHKFAVGTEGLSRYQHGLLLTESKSHNDLLLLDNLQDSYRNLTKKLVLSLKFVSDNLSFRYLLKCDDDTYVKLDIMTAYLLAYHEKLSSVNFASNPAPDLYWGYFNGKANIKTSGQWKETNFNLCSKYLPYALGGGYVISEGLVRYVNNNSDRLSLYASEDISVGIWFASLRNVFRKHDCRFDTAYMARVCKDYYIVLHKIKAENMKSLYAGNECIEENTENNDKRPLEYFYNWKATSMQCCDTLVNW